MSDCLFCKIVAGKIPCTKVYEDEATIAFMDINPGAEGHLLVVPKTHADNLFDISEATLVAATKTARRLGEAMKKTLGIDGLNLFQSSGAAAFQSVFHFHFHLLPRRAGDDLRLPWTPTGADRADLEKLAVKLRTALA